MKKLATDLSWMPPPHRTNFVADVCIDEAWRAVDQPAVAEHGHRCAKSEIPGARRKQVLAAAPADPLLADTKRAPSRATFLWLLLADAVELTRA